MIFFMLSLLGLVPTFQKTKCKKLLNTTMERIKLLRSRREAQLRQLRIDVAKLLQLGKQQKAQVWIGRICKELCLLSVYIKISAYCESVQANLKDIAGQSECPSDLEEPLAGLCFAASCCADLPELQELREIFVMKYGKRFVTSAQELDPNSRVNREFLDCLCAKDLPDHRKQALLEEIIAQYKLKQGNDQALREQQDQETQVIMDANEYNQSPVEQEEATTVLEARNDTENVQEEADGVQESVAVSTVHEEDLGTAEVAQELANRKKASEGWQNRRSAFKRACKKRQQAWLNKSNNGKGNNTGEEAGMKGPHACIRDQSDVNTGEACNASQGEVTTALVRRREGHVVLYVKKPSFSLPPQRPPPPLPPPNRAPPPPPSLVPSRAPPLPLPLRTSSMPNSHYVEHVNTAYAGTPLRLRCSTVAKHQYNESYNGSHVHPRLPKYEDLVANFTALKH